MARLGKKNVHRFDGSQNRMTREKVLREFREAKGEVAILLISLKAGGVGLNLTCANYVFFMDCWWNPAVEDQAVQRCHRIGQTKPVYVYRFVVHNSVEERIVELQKRKTSMTNAVLAQGSDNNNNNNYGGGSKEEQRQKRLTDLLYLFNK